MSMLVFRKSIVLPLALMVPLAAGACRRAEQQATATTGTPASGTAATATSGTDVPEAPPVVDTVIAFETAKVVTRTTIGSGAGADGMVMTSQNRFKPGEPIRLSMWLKDSPPALTTRAVWYDAKEKVVHEEQKAMNGGTKVTFEYKGKRLTPGKYIVVGYWGGNIVAEHPFTVYRQ
jgi:hypothetical protein